MNRLTSLLIVSHGAWMKNRGVREPPGGPEASQESRSALHRMSGDPFFGLMGHREQRLQVAETE